MEQVKLITFEKHSDSRGDLIPIEAMKHVPFPIERIMIVKNMNTLPRGFHSHKITIQVLIPLSGSFEIELTDGEGSKHFLMDMDNKGLLIPINIWAKMYNFTPDCIILMLCSYRYDEKDYVRDYQQFLAHNKEILKIPTFDLTEQTKNLRFSLNKKIQNIIDLNAFVLGKELEEFETNFAAYNSVKYCVGTSTGTSALICALRALNLSPNDEVIVQANTYVAAPLAIEFCNLKIKIVDVDENLNLDLVELEKNLTSNTKVVIVVHLYGMAPDMDKLLALKAKNGFFLIEDTAQAHGSEFSNRKLGSFGDIGCFSFYPSKNLGSFGEGGCVITNNKKYYKYALSYRNYGNDPEGKKAKHQWQIKGTNDRLHNLQAGILNVKLPYLDEWNAKRNKIANLYNLELADIAQIQILQNHPKLYRNYHLYSVLADQRNELLTYLKSKDISCAIHYPETFYKTQAFQELNHYTFPRADSAKTRLLSLPMYPELSLDKVFRVCQAIKQFYLLHHRAFGLMT